MTTLIEAIERGVVACTSAYVRLGGGQVHEEPELTWISTGTPLAFYNGVVRTHLTASDPETVITTMRSRFQERQELMGWWVMPPTSPADLAQRLEAYGFTRFDRDTSMAVDLHAINEALPAPAGLRIERVRTQEALLEWLHTFGRGFGIGDQVLADYSKMPLGAPPDRQPFTYYLARLHEAPVATAMLYPADQVAVIEEVSTIPAVRRQGIGTAVMLAALRDGRAMGYRIGVLQASRMGASVYGRIGFRAYGTRDIYLYRF